MLSLFPRSPKVRCGKMFAAFFKSKRAGVHLCITNMIGIHDVFLTSKKKFTTLNETLNTASDNYPDVMEATVVQKSQKK